MMSVYGAPLLAAAILSIPSALSHTGALAGNIGYTVSTHSEVRRVSQRFNAGGNESGYTATAVGIDNRDRVDPEFSAGVCTATGADQPTTECAEPTPPSALNARLAPRGVRSSTAPQITSVGPFAVAEGTTAVITLTADDDDTPAADLIWSKADGNDGDRFSVSAAGALAFASFPDYENPDDDDGDGNYAVTVQVSDGTDTDMAELVVAVENVIELTAIAGPAAVTFPENGAMRVATFTASSDADRDGIVWTVTGSDAEHFSVDSPSGVLRFHIDPVAPELFPQLPDYEAPDDSGGDNVYNLTLSAAADGAAAVTLAVTVTVTDRDESGSVSLSPLRPMAGSALTATLSDSDDVTGEVAWSWERSVGRTDWAAIPGAASASYTPVAADSHKHLRATATYTDGHGADKKARAVTAYPTIFHPLSKLEVTSTGRALYPTFSPEILHYAVGCDANQPVTLTLSTQDLLARLSVDGVQYDNQEATVTLTGRGGTSDITITVSGADGASTAYVIHCVADDFPLIEAQAKPGAWQGLVSLQASHVPSNSSYAYVTLLDNNGVPWFRHRESTKVRAFKFHRDGRYPYSYAYRNGTIEAFHTATVGTNSIAILDHSLEKVTDVESVAPLTHTDAHDFVVLPNGNYLLLSYEPARRDMSSITDSNGDPLPVNRATLDGVIQEVSAGTETFNWNAWDHIALEDCTQHRRFPKDYVHINALQSYEGDIITSLRGCSQVLRVDRTNGDVVWRLGKSNRSDADWITEDGSAPLKIVNDPEGEFCGQHSPRMLPNGHLILFDNGEFCLEDSETGLPARTNSVFSRAVEYSIDPENGEAIFLRDHSLHGDRDRLARSQGHIEPVDDGTWLIGWGVGHFDNNPATALPPDRTVTQVDPETGTELLSLTTRFADDTVDNRVIQARAFPVPPEALAAEFGPLAATLPTSTHTAASHRGVGDSVSAVVAFSRTIVDFDPDTPSLSVQGATVTAVEPLVLAGEAANAYLVTLSPTGDGTVMFNLVAEQACANDGICTADGAVLEEIPAELAIPRGSAPGHVTAVTLGTGPSELTVSWTEVTGATGYVVQWKSGSDDWAPSRQAVVSGGSTTSHTIPNLVNGTAYMVRVIATKSGAEDGAASEPVTGIPIAVVSLALAPARVSEAAGSTSVSVTATVDGGTVTTEKAVLLSVAGGTATVVQDFVAVSDFTLTIGANGSTGTATFTLTPVDDTLVETTETIVVTGVSTGLSIAPADLTLVDNDAVATEVTLSLDVTEASESSNGRRVTVTGRLNGAARPSATAVTIEVGAATDTATEGSDYATVGALTLTIPASTTSGTVSFTLTPANDRIDESAESLTVSGSTTATGLSVTPPGGLTLDIEDNDAAPSLVLSVTASAIDEDGGTATVTVSTGTGSTFATDQTVQLSVAGTAMETADYTVSGKTLTLPAGLGTSASMVTATVTGVDDNLDDDDEAIEITGSRNSVAFGTRQTIAIDDDDWPVLTVTFRQADYRVAEGAHVELPITLSAVPERQVAISIEVETVGDTEAIDYSVSPATLTFGASETDKTLRVSASNDSVVDPGESVVLSFGTSLPERISEGGTAETTVAIRDTDFTFAPAFAAGSATTESDTDTYTVSENASSLRLSLSLETPRGARVVDVVDPVVVTLATRENAGSRGMDEDYATRRRSGTFGDFGEFDRDLSFRSGRLL